jgi:uncharacterized membrane protein
MQSEKSKYDTNPLDPEVAKETGEVWGQDGKSAETGAIKGATRPVVQQLNESPRSNIHSEAPTRTFDAPPLNTSYPSVFVPPTYAPPPDVYQPPPQPYQAPVAVPRPMSRSVIGLGLPEKWALVLPYLPFHIGIVPAIIELLLVPRSETRVRGHASQALALQAAIIAIEMLFGLVALITGSGIGGTLFKLAAFIFLIISMIRVGQGETHRITPLTDVSEWLNKHIEVRR